MKRTLGYVIGGGLMLVAILTLIFVNPEHPEPEKAEVVRPARVYVVPDAGAIETRTFPGTVKGAERVPLSFRVGGTLASLDAREAQRVTAGEVLARLDARDFQSQLTAVSSQLERAKSQLLAMETGERDEVIKMLEANVRAAKSASESAQTELGRQKTLFDKNLISKSQLDRFKLDADVRAEELEAALQDLERGQSGAREEDIDAQKSLIRSLDAQVAEAQDAVNDTVLRAPFSGLVTQRYVDNFEEVPAGKAVVEIQSVARIDVVADIPETLVALVKKEWIEGFTVTFDFAPGQSYPAKATEMTATADRRTSTYRLQVTLDQPEGVNILPGMTATLLVHLNQSFEAGLQGHLVPADAVFVNPEGEPLIWRVDPSTNRVAQVPVKIGEVVSGQITVQDGIAKGDLVVTAGVHLLEPGQQVRVLEQASN